MNTLIVEKGDAATASLYTQALAYVAHTYRTAFSAEVDLHPPRLVVTLARSGQIACAAGLRSEDEGFFSQHYFDEPIERALSRMAGLPGTPHGMLEVGSFACTSPFATYPTLRAVFDWGRARDIEWGLFTATAEIRRLIVRARISPLMLARADLSRVPAPERWGSYYAHDPWVCAFRDPAQVAAASLGQAESA